MSYHSLVKSSLAMAVTALAVTGCGTNLPLDVTGPVNDCPANLNPDAAIEWSGHGAGLSGNLTANHFQPNTSINKGNINQLELVWSYSYPWSYGTQASAGVTEDAIITADFGGTVVALDKETGCKRWQIDEETGVGSGFTFGPMNANGQGRAVYYQTDNGFTVKRDYTNGNLIWRKKYEDHPGTTSRSSVALHEGVIYLGHSNSEINDAYSEDFACCDSRGVVIAIDAYTGALKWKTYTIDEQPAFEYFGDSVKGPSGANAWGVPFVDAARNSIYVGTGQQYSGPGVSGSDAVIALDMNTGNKKWEFQGIENDIVNLSCGEWLIFTNGNGEQPANCDPDYITPENAVDFDLNATPTLARMGNGQDILIAASKSGEVWGLNPNTGRQVWKTAVGSGGVYGGVHWGFAVDESRKIVYVPISDKTGPKSERVFDFLRNLGSGELENSDNAKPGMYAINYETGQVIWKNDREFFSARDNRTYKPVVSANPVAVDGMVIAGTLSGYLLAFDADDGQIIWQQDTVIERLGTNGVAGTGGAIDANWPIVAGNMLFTDSGYRAGAGGQGNMLQAYRINSSAPNNPTPPVQDPTPPTKPPVQDPTPPSGSNLALNKPVSVSTTERCCTPTGMNDADPQSIWLSWYIDNQWAVIDLGSSQAFSQVNIDWEGGNGRRGYAAQYDIQVSNTNGNWQTVKTINNGDGNQDMNNVGRQTARYVRLNLRKRGALRGFAIKNIEIK